MAAKTLFVSLFLCLAAAPPRFFSGGSSGMALAGAVFALEGVARTLGGCAAQSVGVGTVEAAQKISLSEGGLNASGVSLDIEDLFGRSITAVGDLDGDAVTDICVGAGEDDDGGRDRGSVYVLFLNSNGTVKASQKISSTQGGLNVALDDLDHFGWSIASVGDFDGDTLTDICVGAEYDDDGGANRGAVYVLFLNTNGTAKAAQKISSTQGGLNASGVSLDNGDLFGTSLASMGDFDGDTTTDICVGTYGDDDGTSGVFNNRGAVYMLFLHSNGTVKASQKISSTQGGLSASGVSLDSGDYFGSSVSSLGDFDGDTTTDICVGASFDDDGGNYCGAMYVLFLNTNGTVKASQKISATQGGLTASGVLLERFGEFGSSVASVGDIDGDTVNDICVGASFDDDGGAERGVVYVLFLNRDASVKASQKISSTQGGLSASGVSLDDYDYFGSSIAAVGDFDGDSVTEICVGATGDDDGGRIDPGAVYMLFLSSATPTEVTTNAGLSGATSAAATTGLVGSTAASTAASSSLPSSAVATSAPGITSALPPGEGKSGSSESDSNTIFIVLPVVAVCVLLVCAVLAAAALYFRARGGDRGDSTSSGLVELAESAVDYGALPLNSSVGRISELQHNSVTQSPRDSTDPSMSSRALDKRFVIEWELLRLGDVLASGNFGKVIRGEYQNNDCVIKQLHDQSEAAQAELLREAAQLGSLKPHASLCAFFGACIDPSKPLAIVTEYIEGGNLLSWLRDSSRLVSGVDVLSLGKDLAAGIDALHRSSTLHLDISARNLLVVSQVSPMKLRICDFGLSQTIPKGSDEVSAAGCEVPWRWTDPAVVEDKSFRKDSDVWSFGVTVWEMMARSRPYDEIEKSHDVISFVQEGGRLMQPSENSGVLMSAELRENLFEILLKCWDRDFGNRPSMSDIAGELSFLLKQHTLDFDPRNMYPPEEIAASAARSRAGTADEAYGEAYGVLYNDRAGSGTAGEYGSLPVGMSGTTEEYQYGDLPLEG